MRAYATVLVAFVALGCSAQPPIAANTTADTAPPELCYHDNDFVNGLADPDDGQDLWLRQPLATSFGYVIASEQPADPDTGIANYQLFGYDATLTHIIWSIAVLQSDLAYYQQTLVTTARDTIPFVVHPGSSLNKVKPDELPPQGGSQGVGQIGSTEVVVTNGQGNKHGTTICLDAGDFATLKADYQCLPQATNVCATYACGYALDDCNIKHACGATIAGVATVDCADDSQICVNHKCVTPKIINPPCHGLCQ